MRHQPKTPLLRRLYSLPLLLAFALVVGAGLLFSSPTHAALDAVAISCPNKQTTILTGTSGPPNESLIAYLGARPVGGGSSRQDGTWRIPLQVNERPGIYAVEVKVRGSRAIVGRFTCYVDVSLTATDASPTTAGVAGTPSRPTGGPTALPTAARIASPTSRTTTAVTAATAAATARTTTTVATPVATTATTATTAAPTTTTITTTMTITTTTTTTTTATASSGGIKINDVVCRDPAYPADSEFIELRNDTPNKFTLTGWRISNVSRSNVSYTFPDYTINAGPDVYVAIYSGIGTNQPDFGELWWGRTDQVWFVGDRAELRDSGGKLVDSYTVLKSSCTY
jgi:hypothetical protein